MKAIIMLANSVILLCCLLSKVQGQLESGNFVVSPNRLLRFGSRNWWLRDRFKYQNRYNHPTHIILASHTVRPSTLYRCMVSILNLDHPVDVRASIQRDGVEIASGQKDVVKGAPETLLLKIPKAVVQGDYRLNVEGNVPGTNGGSVFFNETRLHFSTRFLTVLIQTNRPVYTGDQFVRFRIILLTTDLRPYDDPVDVYVVDSDGYVMRRWPSRPTNVGVISMSFKLPFLPKSGYWKIQAVISGQVEEKKFKVEKWYTPLFETKVFMRKFFLNSDHAIEGQIVSEYTTDKGVYGACTIRLYGKGEGSRDWNFIFEQHIMPFDGSYFFNFTMSEVSRRFTQLDGADVKVEAEVMDTFLKLNHTGFSHAKIINSSVDCRFVGSSPFIFKPGMPFYGTVAVSYHDLQPLTQKKLEGSQLIIRAEAVSGSERIPNIVVPHLTEERELNRRLEKAIQRRKMAIEYKYYWGYDYQPDWDYYEEDPYNTAFRYLDENELIAARVDMLLNQSQYTDYRQKGYFEFKINVPPRTTSLTLSVVYNDDEGDTAGSSVEVMPYFSEKEEYLSVETSTKKASVGEFVIFNVRASFQLTHFDYLVTAKNLILHGGREGLDRVSQASLKTISIPVSTDMAPAFTFVVYYSNQDDEIVADSITIPVDSISRHKVNLYINKDKDHTLRTVEMGTWSTAGAFYGISGTRNFTYAMQGGNELSHSSVLEALHSFTNYTRPIHKMTWRSREGFRADNTQYFVTNNYGPDANRTFLFNGLVAITDAQVGVMPDYRENRCNETEGFGSCLISGCYLLERKCNGFRDCADGYDEAHCGNTAEQELIDFRVHQFSRFVELYDPTDGDWMWTDLNIGHKGFEVNTLSLPNADDPYIVNAFSMSAEYGFGLIDAPIQFLSLPPIYMNVEMPDSCRRGETVTLRALIYNTTPRQHMVMVVVHGSDHHKIVQVNDKGVVDYYRPKMLSGDFQHVVTINPDESIEVAVPIAPLLDHGNMTIHISALSLIGRDQTSVTLQIEPEGATINRHTSILFDLKSRALSYEYMDIIIDESYEIPLEIRRRFVAGSPRGHVSLCGDVVGPSFPYGTPVDTEQMVRKKLRSTEASTFNFGANLWTLHYLRLTNQLQYTERRPIFEQLNVELAAIMYRFDADGAFRMWDNAQPSVWLTAWTTRVLQHAQFQDWENLIYIESAIITKAVKWILQFQTDDGSFHEHPAYQDIPLDQKMKSQIYNSRSLNASLTAHVLITLEQTTNALQGQTRTLANNAKFRAMRYLEKNLPLIKDRPYDIAITAYALTLANSVEKETAYNYLHSARREQNGLIYWSKGKVETNSRIRENNQRSLLQPKFEQEFDSHAVEATSYALMVYLIREGVTIDQNRIVDWLNAMRMHDAGFISTVDTLVALQALTEYSYRARLRDITNMKVEVEVTGEAGRQPHEIHIGNQSISHLNILPIENVWGMVSVVGRGAGQAILQLDVSYGVDWYGVNKVPPVDAFQMSIDERFSIFGNKSIATVEICARWVHHKEAEHSSAAVIEIENPTGYVVYQLEAEESIRKARLSTFPSIRDVIGGHADFHQSSTVWFFDFIPGNESWCFKYMMRRWYPVANMTDVRMATIYEQYQPERFQMVMFNSSTSSLDICEVCGSYQCPYCPNYSLAATFNMNTVTLLSIFSIIAVIQLY